MNDDVDSEEVFADLLQRGHVRSETISLPLAGEVDLFAVGRSEFELEGLLERMAFAVESMEGFWGRHGQSPMSSRFWNSKATWVHMMAGGTLALTLC